MSLEITPPPSDEERAAILAALAAETAETAPSPWAGAALPRRADDEQEP